MIEGSRKHGPFDSRWPTAVERAASRASRADEQVRPREGVPSWESEGGGAATGGRTVTAGARR
jgi:hypothetical protein